MTRAAEQNGPPKHAAARYYNKLLVDGRENIVVLGDLNDTPDSEALQLLTTVTTLRDLSEHPNFTDFEFGADNGNCGIGTFGLGIDSLKIDLLMLSPALWARVTNAGLFRKGAWPGSAPKRWEVYPVMTRKEHAVSDHHPIFADIDI